uniref:Uncharacterized protein n=1 Tax=viral metagenome TaxID=1070528 RepID=A0A6M3J064_9ZZZZ
MSGGSSGSVVYPVYIAKMIEAWLKDEGDDAGHIAAGTDITSLMQTAIAGDSPYTGDTAYDPNSAFVPVSGSPLDEVQDRFDTAKTAIDAIVANTDWTAYIAAAVTKMDAAGGVFPALTYPGAAFSTTSTPPAEGSFASANLSALVTAIAADAITKASSVLTTATTGAIAVAHSDAVGLIPSDAEAAAVSKIGTALSTIITNAIADAETAVNTTYIQNIVDGFEARANKRYNRAMNNFMGGMADIGAVNTSAFMMGLVAFESDKQDEINSFDAQITQGMYEKIVQLYITTYVESYNRYIAEYIQVSLAVLGEQSKMYLATFMSYLSEEVRAKIAYLTNTAQYQTTQLSEEARIINTANELKTRLLMQPAESRAQAIISGTGSMMNMLMAKSQTQLSSAQIQGEIDRMKIVALKDQADRDIELDVFDAEWDMSVYKHGAIVMSAPSGAGVLPGRPSTFQTVMGGIGQAVSIGTGMAQLAGG